MIQFHFLSGKKAGTSWVARQFPFWAGRSPEAELALDESAVWDRHFQITFHTADGFVLTTTSETFVIINGQQTQEAVLKSGDLLEIGLLKMRFSLTPARQKALSTREALFWGGLVLLGVVELAVICLFSS